MGRVHFINVHLASPRSGLVAVIEGYWRGGAELQANSDLRRWQSAAIRHWAEKLTGPVLIAGDFNTPVESTIYREHWSTYTNAFSFAGWGVGNTHFTRRTGVRIDHVLANKSFRAQRCWVGPDLGSAHRPLVATFRRLGD